jgi:hypothetical protein
MILQFHLGEFIKGGKNISEDDYSNKANISKNIFSLPFAFSFPA